MKKYLFITLAFLALLSGSRAYGAGDYALIRLDGTVNPIIAEHIVKSIKAAGQRHLQFIVLQIDTPGGLMTSMQEIIEGIMESKIPVVVYAYPRGAQAASAGGYIMLSANIAAMAPGTRIGAMHPVNILEQFSKRDEREKGGVSVMNIKLLNDSIAYARSLAQRRNRNTAWAEAAVRDAISSTYSEALRQRVIDIVAEDMDDLLRQLNGRRVAMNGTTVTIQTASIQAVEYPMDWKRRFLNFVADPQIVFFLFIIAIIGIGMEVKSPGLIFPGLIGGLSLFVFLMAVRILPVNFAGVALIILAVVLFILELKFTSYGLLTAGGLASFVIGSMILFDSPLPGFSIPLSTIMTVVISIIAFIFIILRAVVRAHRGRITTGLVGMIGEMGMALGDFVNSRGKISIHGEIWNAVVRHGDIRKNDEVKVIGSEGMVLIIEKADQKQ